MTHQPSLPEAVRRFTTEYVVHEDRIRISIEREDESILVLWLTRRLAARMVVHIAKALDALPRMKGQAQKPHSDNAQRRNQMDALGKIKQQAPVLTGPMPDGLDAHLIVEMDLRLTRTGALLDFKHSKEVVVQTLPLNEEALRQWLGVLYLNFQKAQWQEEIWPTWITSKGWDVGPDALRLN